MTQRRKFINPKPAYVILKCGHNATFYPRPFEGDEVFCRKCFNFSTVTSGDVERKRHTINCTECRYRQSFACHLDVAITKADTHSLKLGHVVEVKNVKGEELYVTTSLSVSMVTQRE